MCRLLLLIFFTVHTYLQKPLMHRIDCEQREYEGQVVSGIQVNYRRECTLGYQRCKHHVRRLKLLLGLWNQAAHTRTTTGDRTKHWNKLCDWGEQAFCSRSDRRTAKHKQ